MSQNTVPPSASQCDRPPKPCPRPIWEWVLIGVLSLLLLAVVIVAMTRGSGSGGKCGGSSCAADSDSLESYIARCTRDDGFTPTYCAEMWERVKGTRKGR